MADDTYRSQFRLPYDLYERLKAEADKKHRSLNAEIVARLQESLEVEPREDIGDEVRELKQQMDKQNEMLTLALRALRHPEGVKGMMSEDRLKPRSEDNDQ